MPSLICYIFQVHETKAGAISFSANWSTHLIQSVINWKLNWVVSPLMERWYYFRRDSDFKEQNSPIPDRNDVYRMQMKCPCSQLVLFQWNDRSETRFNTFPIGCNNFWIRLLGWQSNKNQTRPSRKRKDHIHNDKHLEKMLFFVCILYGELRFNKIQMKVSNWREEMWNVSRLLD